MGWYPGKILERIKGARLQAGVVEGFDEIIGAIKNLNMRYMMDYLPNILSRLEKMAWDMSREVGPPLSGALQTLYSDLGSVAEECRMLSDRVNRVLEGFISLSREYRRLKWVKSE